jgi:hypothetical protein
MTAHYHLLVEMLAHARGDLVGAGVSYESAFQTLEAAGRTIDDLFDDAEWLARTQLQEPQDGGCLG